MAKNNDTLPIVFQNTGEGELQVGLEELRAALVNYLEHLAVRPLIDHQFYAVVGDGDSGSKLARLLEATGHAANAGGFFRELLDRLGRAEGGNIGAFNGVELPHLLLMAVLEVVLPGNRFISVKSTEQLEKIANIKVEASARGDMQKVIDTYPVRLSMHTLRQMRVSPNVAYQYLPFVEELDTIGHTNTWIGQFHQGLLEQMYQNRVIFLLNMGCPVYCRFCFRKHKEARNQENPTVDDVAAALEHVRNSPSVKEIVVTGGDPFMNRDNMAATIDGLICIDHVQSVRLATRSVAYYPHMFLAEDGRLLNYLKRKNLELQERGKRMELATHFIHPDEVSPQALRIISELVRAGVAVYVQTPFLKDCNDKGPELVRLFSLLRGAGAELHYIYIPCSPIHGNSIYWAPISKGLEVGRYLRAHLSDRVVPRICTATPIGKMDWHTSGWAVEPVEGNDNFIWIRSPYTPEYFKAFAPLANELDNIRVNEEGTIDIQYMARLGDDSLFLGARPVRPAGQQRVNETTAPVLDRFLAREVPAPSLVDTGSVHVSRVHETRVEVDLDVTAGDLRFIQDDERVTDVVIVAPEDAVDSLSRVKKICSMLEEFPFVNAIRLRSRKFNYEPECYTAEVIDCLAGLNRLSVANPKRLEIETQFLVPEEFSDEHGRLAGKLRNRGITVYANTPLLGRINDTADTIHRLAYACRQAGIEFHHLYVAGLPVQDGWNSENPVSLYDVIDIATRVRRDGSGREVPRYIVRTICGEADFGLCATISGKGTDLTVKLLPYSLDYYRGLSADFKWPEGVSEAADGCPEMKITGLLKVTDFALC